MTADYQGLVTKWREAVRDCPCLECRMRNECADELAEAIARNVQPSPDESLRQAREKWIGDEYRAARMPMAERDAFDAGWNAAHVQQPSPDELRTRLLKIASKVAQRQYLPSLEKCRTITDARIEVARYDEYHAALAQQLKDVFDALALHEPATEPLCKTIRDIIENEPLGYRTEDEHAKLENFADRILAKIAAALALRDVPQGQTRRERRLEKALMLAAEFCNTMPGWDKARNMQAAIEEVLAARQVPVGPEGKK